MVIFLQIPPTDIANEKYTDLDSYTNLIILQLIFFDNIRRNLEKFCLFTARIDLLFVVTTKSSL